MAQSSGVSTLSVPPDWKTYDDFARGIATNRLPATDALVGRSLRIAFADAGGRTLTFDDAARLTWSSDGEGGGSEWCEVIAVASDTYLVDMTFSARPRESETLILNTTSRRALSVRSVVRAAEDCPGEPQVAQIFRPGTIEGGEPSGMVPGPTRDLIGLRAHFTYSPEHTYEHTYLSSERYCWQCLVGVQRGHGDVDLATTYKFADGQYVFTFREFKIPVASTFFYDFASMRSTGKFLGIASNGQIENKPAGALIRRKSVTFYESGAEPV